MLHSSPEALSHRPQAWLKPAAVIGGGLAVLIVAAGLLSRGLASQHLKADVQADSTPVVALVSPSATLKGEGLTLPGQVDAWQNAVIHARVSGYLKKWYVDIGAHVKAGQVLADIDTPELDQQLAQSKANLGTAVANQSLAKSTSDRWANLLTRDAVSKQEAEEKAGDLAAKTALVAAAQADVDRLQALEGFKRIVAPFDGVVTARNTDIGALIAAGNPADPGLFTVSDVHRLRVYVRVPQSYSALVKPGAMATLTVPEYPNRSFTAQLISSAGAIGAQSGAVLMELQLDNKDESLKPGEYTQTKFAVAAQGDVVRLPASALMLRPSGMVVAVLGADGKVQIKPIKVARDLGASVDVAGGIDVHDQVVNNPPDSLVDGETVKVAAPAIVPAAKEG